jgi:hypothetical protein
LQMVKVWPDAAYRRQYRLCQRLIDAYASALSDAQQQELSEWKYRAEQAESALVQNSHEYHARTLELEAAQQEIERAKSGARMWIDYVYGRRLNGVEVSQVVEEIRVWCGASDQIGTPLVAQQPTWQPIETAPKDGSPICAGMMHPFWGWVWGRCRWHVDKNEPYGGYFSGDGLQPTHWMPLPSPPSALKDEE